MTDRRRQALALGLALLVAAGASHALAPPELDIARDADDLVAVTFAAPSGASGYDVYRGGRYLLTVRPAAGSDGFRFDGGAGDYCVVAFVETATGTRYSPCGERVAIGPSVLPPGPPPAPRELRARVYSPGVAELFWTPGEGRSAVIATEVHRDGEPLARTDGRSLFQPDLEPGRRYRYTLVGVDRHGSRSAPVVIEFDATLAGNVPPDPGASSPPGTPSGFAATRYSPFDAELAWQRSPEHANLAGYELRRDGERVAFHRGLSHYEPRLRRDRDYRYSLVAIGRDGARSAPATLSVRGDARIEPRTLAASPAGVALGPPRRLVADGLADERGDAATVRRFAPGGAPRRLELTGFRQTADGEDSLEDVLSYDLDADALVTLITMRLPEERAYLSRDGAVAAIVDGCLARVRQLAVQSLPVTLIDGWPANACARSARVSDRGDAMVFPSARGVLDDDGVLRYDGTEPNRFGPVLHVPASGLIENLARDARPLGDAVLDAFERQLIPEGFSDDGGRLLLSAWFLPREREGVVDYIGGTIVVDVSSATLRMLGTTRYRGLVCRRCPFGGNDAVALSGNGRIVWRQASDVTIDRGDFAYPLPSSYLERIDLDSGVVQRVAIDGVADRSGIGETLHVSRDGDILAFLSGGRPRVYDARRKLLIDPDRALRFCNSSGSCAFDGYRIVRDRPLSLSADGSALLIGLIPERDDIVTPQNVQELMLLDIDERSLVRVAPGADVDFFALSDDGRAIAFNSGTPGLVADDTDGRVDLFVIER